MGMYTVYKLEYTVVEDIANVDKVAELMKLLNEKGITIDKDIDISTSDTSIDFLIRQALEYTSEALDERGMNAKWYDHHIDMLIVSRQFPNVLFELNGVGEEYPDIWRTYYKAGLYQHEKAVIEFGKYNADKLQ